MYSHQPWVPDLLKMNIPLLAAESAGEEAKGKGACVQGSRVKEDGGVC